MLAKKYISKENTIEVHILPIENLFNKYKDLYIQAFELNHDTYLAMRNFKLARGGYVVVIKINSIACGFYSLSNQTNEFGEFGDLFKTSSDLSRDDFAAAIKIGLKKALVVMSLKGFYSYQNNRALKLVNKAGFVRKTYYERHMSLVIMNFIIKLPIKIVNRQVYPALGTLKLSPLRFSFRLCRTRLSRFNIPYLRHKINMELLTKNFNPLGFLIEFHEVPHSGDSLMFFGDLSSYNLETGYEYSDNSA